ncbi:MAG TPA: MXAN_5187 C-terminal domain-containing protein [Pyrinomonadaceae bacterium]
MRLKENRLLRAKQQVRLKNKFNVGDSPPTPDEQLTRLEEDIRRLRIEFDIFFNGAAKRPPYDTKGRVETLIKRLGDDRTLTYAQRFRYNSLIARYNAFRDLWRRTMQGREEGRDLMSAARVSARQQAPVSAAPLFYVCDDAHKEVATVKSLYDSLIDAKRSCGESVEDLSFPRFHSLIASKADGLKERLGCERVKFSVAIEDGHVSFKAKAERGENE